MGLAGVEHRPEFAFLQHLRAHGGAAEGDRIILGYLIGGEFLRGKELRAARLGNRLGHGLGMTRAAPINNSNLTHDRTS